LAGSIDVRTPVEVEACERGQDAGRSGGRRLPAVAVRRQARFANEARGIKVESGVRAARPDVPTRRLTGARIGMTTSRCSWPSGERGVVGSWLAPSLNSSVSLAPQVPNHTSIVGRGRPVEVGGGPARRSAASRSPHQLATGSSRPPGRPRPRRSASACVHGLAVP
jgi:hypothetical protein